MLYILFPDMDICHSIPHRNLAVDNRQRPAVNPGNAFNFKIGRQGDEIRFFPDQTIAEHGDSLSVRGKYPAAENPFYFQIPDIFPVRQLVYKVCIGTHGTQRGMVRIHVTEVVLPLVIVIKDIEEVTRDTQRSKFNKGEDNIRS